MADLQSFAPAAVLGIGCLLLSGVREQKKMPPAAPIPSIAMGIPGYQPRDTVIDAQEQKVAGMSNYVLRLFQRDSTDPGFSVYVGYYDYQVQGKTIHSPKNCLPGAGWEQLTSGVQPVTANGKAYAVNRYLLANKGAQALIYYWYEGRGRVEANEYRVKLNLLHDAALYGRTEEALVRIVVPIDPRALRTQGEKAVYAAADTLATTLTTQLIPNVAKALPAAPGA